MNEVDTFAGVATIHPHTAEGEQRAREHLVRDAARKLADKLADGNVYAVRIKIDGPHVEESDRPYLSPRRTLHGRLEISRVTVEPYKCHMVSQDPREMPLARLIPTATTELWSRTKRAAGRLRFWRRG